MKLQEEVRQLRIAAGAHLHEPDLRIPMLDTRASPIAESELPSPSSHPDHQRKLSQAAVPELDSFFVSPLPEFSSRGLSTVSMDLFSLPDIVGDVEKKPHKKSIHGKDAICDSKYHPTACRCSQALPLPEMPHSVMVTSASSAARSRGMSVVERSTTSDSPADHSSLLIAPEVKSGPPVGEDTFRYQPQRQNSHSSRQSSISRSPSRAPSRPSSPARRPLSTQQAHSRISSPMDLSTSPSVNMSLSQAAQGKVSNPRLHDLLQDTNSSTVSSSLPNMPSHFPPSITRDSRSSRSRDHLDSPSRSRSRSSHRSSLPPPGQVHEHHIASIVPEPSQSTINHPTSSYHTVGTVVSTASTAASLLEKAKRERRKAEEEERQKERDKSERDSARRERDKAERDRDRGKERDKFERDRDPSERERERDRSDKDQRRVEEKRSRERQTSSASSYSVPTAHREQPSNIYAPSTPVAVPYVSQRSSGHSSSRSGSSALRDSYNAHKHTTHALPVLGTTRV
jgi:hypothetical protein